MLLDVTPDSAAEDIGNIIRLLRCALGNSISCWTGVLLVIERPTVVLVHRHSACAGEPFLSVKTEKSRCERPTFLTLLTGNVHPRIGVWSSSC